MEALLPPGLTSRLLASADPAARWVALTGLEHRAVDDPAVAAAHAEVVAGPATQDLVRRLHPWEEWHPIGGHDKPDYLPNLLALLADRGVGAHDVPAIGQLHRSMLAHADDAGRFRYLGRGPRGSDPVWSSLPCDHHAITEVLLRAGYADHPTVQRAVQLIASRLTQTSQGPAWECLPDPVVGFRGPGRKGDACPQVTVEALRVSSYLPAEQRPPFLREALHTTLGFWRRRGEERPYMFGHGVQFKRGKWPVVWYSAFEVVGGRPLPRGLVRPGRRPGRPAVPGGDRRVRAGLLVRRGRRTHAQVGVPGLRGALVRAEEAALRPGRGAGGGRCRQAGADRRRRPGGRRRGADQLGGRERLSRAALTAFRSPVRGQGQPS